MRSARYFKIIACSVGGCYTALFLFSATLRLVYPYEVEWNEGAVLDHAIRVLHGIPIYATPTLDFAAFIYTPLYYYVTAFVMMIVGVGPWAGRLVSIVSSLATALMIGIIIRKESRSGNKGGLFVPISGAMLYLAFYHATGFFYDIVRMDAFAILLVVASIYIAFYVKKGFLFSAVFVALAYFTKQQMIFVWPALLIYFLLRSKQEAARYATVSFVLLLIGTVILNSSTNGSYSFYTYTIPSIKAANQFSWRSALEFFPEFVFAEFGSFTIVIVISLLLSPKWKDNNNFMALLLCGILAMFSASLGLGNPGGYDNVLMPLAAMLAILFPLCVSLIETTVPRLPSFTPMLFILAYVALAFNPLGEIMLFASARQGEAGKEFISKLREIPGDVWIPFHGYIGTLAGKPTHVHFMAMNDALVPGDSRSAQFQRAIDSSLAAHRFSAIVLDQEHVFGWDSIAHYSRSGEVFQVPNVFLSRLGSAPTRPQYVYLPLK